MQIYWILSQMEAFEKGNLRSAIKHLDWNGEKNLKREKLEGLNAKRLDMQVTATVCPWRSLKSDILPRLFHPFLGTVNINYNNFIFLSLTSFTQEMQGPKYYWRIKSHLSEVTVFCCDHSPSNSNFFWNTGFFLLKNLFKDSEALHTSYHPNVLI